MKEKCQTELLCNLHETARGLHKIGVISNEEMRKYNKNCHSPDSESAH
jgi:DNA-binding transcriptional regulator YiaG